VADERAEGWYTDPSWGDPESGSLQDRMREAGKFGATWGGHIALNNPQGKE
jgi:hypothetical protein